MEKLYPWYLKYHSQTSFFEVTQFFANKMIKLVFGTYDGEKKVEVFLTVQEARQIEDDIRSGRILARLKEAKENQTVYETQAKGKGGRYRYFSIIRGSKSPYVLAGQSGPGEETSRGLVKIAGPPDTTVIVPVPQMHDNVPGEDGKTSMKAGGLKALADALSDAVADCYAYTLISWMSTRAEKEGSE